ncbi:MAB_1171c family putative transporter [Streptomyces albogriseolus]|uniref:MAB_1171c family putative transporter n=1 Tax=Streptomyces TaxID=1883 RepID=UPI003CE9F68D
MSDALAYAIAGLLLVQAVLRAKSALRGRVRERSLWGAFAALAASWLARTEPGRNLLNGFGVTDLAYLVKHVLAILGICVLLKYVTAVYRTADDAAKVRRSVRISALVHRVATRASLITVTVMAAVFFIGLDEPDTSTVFFLARHAGEPELAVYMGLFYLYTAAAAAVCAVQWGGAVSQAPMRSLKIGLRMMSASMVLAVVYAVLRIGYLILITVHPVSDAFAIKQEAVTDTILYATFLLYGLGAIAPASHAAGIRYRTLRSLRDLHPLWRDLALTAPQVVRHRPSQLLGNTKLSAPVNRLRDLFGHDDSPTRRLGRYVTEIRDVIYELRRHAPEGLVDWARRQAELDGVQGSDADITAEAYWIRGAKVELAEREAGLPAPFPFGAGDDLAEEIPHLRAVAAVYGRIGPVDTRENRGGPSTPVAAMTT